MSFAHSGEMRLLSSTSLALKRVLLPKAFSLLSREKRTCARREAKLAREVIQRISILSVSKDTELCSRALQPKRFGEYVLSSLAPLGVFRHPQALVER